MPVATKRKGVSARKERGTTTPWSNPLCNPKEGYVSPLTTVADSPSASTSAMIRSTSSRSFWKVQERREPNCLRFPSRLSSPLTGNCLSITGPWGEKTTTVSGDKSLKIPARLCMGSAVLATLSVSAPPISRMIIAAWGTSAPKSSMASPPLKIITRLYPISFLCRRIKSSPGSDPHLPPPLPLSPAENQEDPFPDLLCLPVAEEFDPHPAPGKNPLPAQAGPESRFLPLLLFVIGIVLPVVPAHGFPVRQHPTDGHLRGTGALQNPGELPLLPLFALPPLPEKPGTPGHQVGTVVDLPFPPEVPVVAPLVFPSVLRVDPSALPVAQGKKVPAPPVFTAGFQL